MPFSLYAVLSYELVNMLFNLLETLISLLQITVFMMDTSGHYIIIIIIVIFFRLQ